MKTIVTRSVVLDKSGHQLAPRLPMATRCEPSQRAIARARSASLSQREARERQEAMNLLASYGWEPRPLAPEIPAVLAHWQKPDPDPVLNREFIAGLLAGALLSASAMTAFLTGGRS